MCVCVCVYLIKWNRHFVSVYSIIDLFSYSYEWFDFGWNDFRKSPYVSQLFKTPTVVIFAGVNYEIKKTRCRVIYMHFYQGQREERGKGNFPKKIIFLDIRRIGVKYATRSFYSIQMSNDLYEVLNWSAIE